MLAGKGIPLENIFAQIKLAEPLYIYHYKGLFKSDLGSTFKIIFNKK